MTFRYRYRFIPVVRVCICDDSTRVMCLSTPDAHAARVHPYPLTIMRRCGTFPINDLATVTATGTVTRMRHM